WPGVLYFQWDNLLLRRGSVRPVARCAWSGGPRLVLSLQRLTDSANESSNGVAMHLVARGVEKLGWWEPCHRDTRPFLFFSRAQASPRRLLPAVLLQVLIILSEITNFFNPADPGSRRESKRWSWLCYLLEIAVWSGLIFGDVVCFDLQLDWAKKSVVLQDSGWCWCRRGLHVHLSLAPLTRPWCTLTPPLAATLTPRPHSDPPRVSTLTPPQALGTTAPGATPDGPHWCHS
ncbi:unnamed protein product, partial [Boreogadus saida]